MYIDPSAGTLILQLLVGALVGLQFLLRRGFHRIGGFLGRDLSEGFYGLLIAVSFANLSLLRIWTELFGFSESDAFEMKAPPPWTHFAGALLDLILITLPVWVLVRKMSLRGPAGTCASAALLILWAIPLNAARDVLGSEYFPMLRFGVVRAFGPTTVAGVCVALVVLGTAAIAWFGRPINRVLCLLLLASSPFTLITVGRALSHLFVPPAPFSISDEDRAHRGRGRTVGSRVVWLLFDEMDQRIAFEDRPPGLKLPEFDRLRSAAVYASAVREAGENTIPAVPSLLTGKTVVRARELGLARLGLTFEGSSKEVDLRTTLHIFRRAGNLGFSSGVTGWDIPYCRLFGAELDRCWWCEAVRFDNSIRTGLAGATVDGLRSLFETMNFSLFGQSICVRQQVENVASLTRESIETARDDNLDLVFLHLHGAHPPHAYDRRRLDFSLSNSPIAGYADSLALCDITLGRIRRELEFRGVWDHTAVLVSSDHHSRSSHVFDGKTDHRSIFILKMAGQNRGVVFDRPINAVVSGDLVLEILKGSVKNVNDVTAWLTERS